MFAVCGLPCWDIFLLFLVSSGLCHKENVISDESEICIYWDDHDIYILKSFVILICVCWSNLMFLEQKRLCLGEWSQGNWSVVSFHYFFFVHLLFFFFLNLGLVLVNAEYIEWLSQYYFSSYLMEQFEKVLVLDIS